ncbi:MAG TPA: hypothetical protein VIV11_23610 [Kofleriaceae bacterium]
MREASELPQPSIVDLDPEDPAQLLDDVGQYGIVDLEVEAQPSVEARDELDAAGMIASADEEEEEQASEVDDDARELDTPEATTADAYAEAADDTGDLYGVHTQKATDRGLDKTQEQDEYIDAEAGENWLETLGKKAAEYGAEVEQEIEVIDDSDEHREHRGHSSSDRRDRPVADKGSGGDGGL